MAEPLGYRVVFDLASSGYTAWHEALLPIGVAMAAATLNLVASRSDPTGRDREIRVYRWITALAAVLAAVTAVFVFTLSWREYRGLRAALRDRTYRIVEGPVTDFVPQPPGGHRMERFRVGGDEFVYSAYVMTSAFHQTAARGGPIHEGLLVRVAAVGGAIVRLEIAK